MLTPPYRFYTQVQHLGVNTLTNSERSFAWESRFFSPFSPTQKEKFPHEGRRHETGATSRSALHLVIGFICSEFLTSCSRIGN